MIKINTSASARHARIASAQGYQEFIRERTGVIQTDTIPFLICLVQGRGGWHGMGFKDKKARGGWTGLQDQLPGYPERRACFALLLLYFSFNSCSNHFPFFSWFFSTAVASQALRDVMSFSLLFYFLFHLIPHLPRGELMWLAAYIARAYYIRHDLGP